MYEEYLEDYVYKLMSKIASRMCYMLKSKKESKITSNVKHKQDSSQITTSEKPKAIESKVLSKDKDTDKKDEIETTDESKSLISKNKSEEEKVNAECDEKKSEHIDEDLNNINFHMMMFFLWMVVTVVNIPPLLTWARNFK